MSFPLARFGELSPVLCLVCGRVLHPALIGAGYATHPCCDQDETAWEWKTATADRVVIPLTRPRRMPQFRRPSEVAAERGAWLWASSAKAEAAQAVAEAAATAPSSRPRAARPARTCGLRRAAGFRSGTRAARSTKSHLTCCKERKS